MEGATSYCKQLLPEFGQNIHGLLKVTLRGDNELRQQLLEGLNEAHSKLVLLRQHLGHAVQIQCHNLEVQWQEELHSWTIDLV